MTISAFANQQRPAGLDGYRSIRRAHREQKRRDAEDRQATFDAEVQRTAREQNITEPEARRIVRARRRHEHRTGRPTPITLSRKTPDSRG